MTNADALATHAANAEFTALVVTAVASRVAAFAVLAWDERRMTDDERARAFPAATRLQAVVNFGVVPVFVHFARTRRGLVAYAKAALATVVVTIATALAAGLAQTLHDACK